MTVQKRITVLYVGCYSMKFSDIWLLFLKFKSACGAIVFIHGRWMNMRLLSEALQSPPQAGVLGTIPLELVCPSDMWLPLYSQQKSHEIARNNLTLYKRMGEFIRNQHPSRSLTWVQTADWFQHFRYLFGCWFLGSSPLRLYSATLWWNCAQVRGYSHPGASYTNANRLILYAMTKFSNPHKINYIIACTQFRFYHEQKGQTLLFDKMMHVSAILQVFWGFGNYSISLLLLIRVLPAINLYISWFWF